MTAVLTFLLGLLLGAAAVLVAFGRVDRWTLVGAWKLLTTSIRTTTHHGQFTFVTPPEWDWTEDGSGVR